MPDGPSIAADELVSQAVGGTNTSFAYYAWGRMTSKSDGTYSATYAYRYDDKLCFVTSDFPDEGNVSYTYGSDGKRRSRTAGGTTTRYRWDVGWNMLNEEDNLGNLTRTHVMDSPLAQVANVLADVAGTNPATGAYRYYGSDHLGSTRGLYDGGKSALGGYEYTPYGEVYANSGSVALEGLAAAFTGKPWDAAAQMYYFPYRWYSPSSARWLTRDPLGMVDGPNVYGYVRNMPVQLIDPEGLLPIWALEIVRNCGMGAAIGVVEVLAELAMGSKKDACDFICGALGGCAGGVLGGVLGKLLKLLPVRFPKKPPKYIPKPGETLPPMGIPEVGGGVGGGAAGGVSCGLCEVTCRNLKKKLGL